MLKQMTKERLKRIRADPGERKIWQEEIDKDAKERIKRKTAKRLAKKRSPGRVVPEKVKEMKKLTKAKRNEQACEILTPLNADEVIAARQAQIDLKEKQEDRGALEKKTTKKK